MKKFFDAYKYLTVTSTTGINIKYQEGFLVRYIPYIRALEYIKIFFEGKIDQQQLNEIKLELDTIRENDSSSLNKMGIVNLD